ADAVVGSVDDEHLVAGLERAGGGDREVGAGAPGRDELAWEERVAHARAELGAGHAGAGDLQLDRADAPALADPRAGDVDAGERQVLTERRGLDRAADLGLPPRHVLA